MKILEDDTWLFSNFCNGQKLVQPSQHKQKIQKRKLFSPCARDSQSRRAAPRLQKKARLPLSAAVTYRFWPNTTLSKACVILSHCVELVSSVVASTYCKFFCQTMEKKPMTSGHRMTKTAAGYAAIKREKFKIAPNIIGRPIFLFSFDNPCLSQFSLWSTIIQCAIMKNHGHLSENILYTRSRLSVHCKIISMINHQNEAQSIDGYC